MTGFLIFMTLSLTASGVQVEGECFPGARETKSPAGGRRILYRWQGDHHVLYFERARGAAPVRLAAFERAACVHWAPDGDRFALTVFAGSNLTAVEVIRSDDLSKRARLDQALLGQERALLSGSLHVEAVSWDVRGLVIRVHGERAGEPEGFDRQLRCTIFGSSPHCEVLDNPR
jgi:hypothetical protein